MLQVQGNITDFFLHRLTYTVHDSGLLIGSEMMQHHAYHHKKTTQKLKVRLSAFLC
jgi:hypothetical protein